MRIASEEIRQAADTIAATAEALHKGHNTNDSWQCCMNPFCLRAARVHARLNAQVGPRPKMTRQQQRRIGVATRLEQMLG